MKHLILINFKTYKEGTGKKGLKLAREIGSFKSDKYQLAIAPQAVDLKGIVKAVRIPVFAQHMDGISFGAHTGSILPESLKEAGVKGTLLNHSEKKLSLKEIKRSISCCKRLRLLSLVCASNLEEAREIARFHPDYLAYEPKELVGGGVSVTKAKPEIISKVVKLVGRIDRKVKVLCGAGIQSREDIKKALALGTEGVLIAHKVVKAKKVKVFLGKLLG